MKHIAYYENERDIGERFSSESMEEIVAWFRDSFIHHVGKEPDAEFVDALVSGGVVMLLGDLVYEWHVS